MAMSSQGVYSQTLESIIAAKLEELVYKRDAFEKSKSGVVKALESQLDSQEQLKILLEGTKACFQVSRNASGSLVSSNTHNPQLFSLLNNLERFCEQPRFDPSVSKKMLSAWKGSLMRELEGQSSRYEYASLYARLVTDWLSCEKGLKAASTSNEMEVTDDFEELDTSAKMESRLAWEADVFHSANVDAVSIKKLLVRLFGQDDDRRKPVFQALKHLRSQVASFESEMAEPEKFTEATVGLSIDGLLLSDLLKEEKRTVLKDFRQNSVILAELADVLNLRMANGIENWTWGDVVPLEQQRRVAGYYSIHMHEDILQAIFLQYIGVKWSVFLKNSLLDFIETKRAWNVARAPTADDAKRREYYLGRVKTKSSIQSKRARLWKRRYFITQLPSSENLIHASKDGGEEVQYSLGMGAPQMPSMQMQMMQAPTGQPSRPAGRAKQTARAPQSMFVHAKRQRAVNHGNEFTEDDDDEETDDESAAESRPGSLMDLKQGLLHVLRTEILVNGRLHGGITAFRGQFQQWNTLLPHTTVMIVLTWFGVSRKWLKFFETFMQAPLAFMRGNSTESPRSRKRGVPGSHPLSDVLGESILFCLDLAVNQNCDGTCLYRIYDDFWFWHPNELDCVKAWSTISEFADTMGLTLDLGSSGSANIRTANGDSAPKSGLPSGPIRWGFLYLDSKTGQFEIDNELVDRHVEDLKHQLDQKVTKGVLAWIQAFNVYANTFFTTNFGKAANCFGESHTDKVLAVFGRVQQRIFSNSSVVDYLRAMLEDCYGIKDVPEGYVFFPTELGGLELQNPFITLLQSYKPGIHDNPETVLNGFFEAEAEAYLEAKDAFMKDRIKRRPSSSGSHYIPKDKDEFFSFDEYTRHREFYCNGHEHNELGDVFSHLLKTPAERPIESSAEMLSALRLIKCDHVIARSSVKRDWHTMTAYWKWVVEMYGPDIVSKFRGLNIVDSGILPIGMVSLFRSEKVQWKG